MTGNMAAAPLLRDRLSFLQRVSAGDRGSALLPLGPRRGVLRGSATPPLPSALSVSTAAAWAVSDPRGTLRPRGQNRAGEAA